MRGSLPFFFSVFFSFFSVFPFFPYFHFFKISPSWSVPGASKARFCVEEEARRTSRQKQVPFHNRTHRNFFVIRVRGKPSVRRSPNAKRSLRRRGPKIRFDLGASINIAKFGPVRAISWVNLGGSTPVSVVVLSRSDSTKNSWVTVRGQDWEVVDNKQELIDIQEEILAFSPY